MKSLVDVNEAFSCKLKEKSEKKGTIKMFA